MTSTIRFGVICEGDSLPTWQVHCLEALASLPGVECALRVRATQAPAGGGSPDRMDGAGARLFRLYRDRWARPRAQRPASPPAWLDDAPQLACASLDAATCARIASHGLDLVLHLSGPEPDAASPALARHGLFGFQVGGRPERWPPVFWEVLRGESVIHASFCRWLAPGRRVPLKQARFATSRHSWARSVDEVHFACAHWARELCVDLRNGNAQALEASPSPSPATDHAAPGVGSMLRFLFVQALALARRVAGDLLRHEQWTIGVAPRPIQSFVDAPDTGDVTWLPPLGRDRYLADPFAATVGGRRFVLSELYDHRTAHATIAAWALESGAGSAPPRAPDPVTVIEADVHLSYPFVFEHEGATWCIPESCAAREIALYRADPGADDRGPVRWDRVATLVEGIAAADATLFRHDGLFWIACNDVERGRHRDLCLFHAEDLLGPWTPHATNPVLMDVVCARPAGTPFVHEGQLYRPAQDCSTGYGTAVVLRRVTHLSPTGFREVTEAVVRPDPASGFPDGIHTLSAAGDETLLDAKRTIFHPREALHVLRSALRKRL